MIQNIENYITKQHKARWSIQCDFVLFFGVGRIGSVHADNINANPRTTLKYVVDIDGAAASRLAGKYGATTADVDIALADSSIDAVLIASATATAPSILGRL